MAINTDTPSSLTKAVNASAAKEDRIHMIEGVLGADAVATLPQPAITDHKGMTQSYQSARLKQLERAAGLSSNSPT